jgi:signal peptidase
MAGYDRLKRARQAAIGVMPAGTLGIVKKTLVLGLVLTVLVPHVPLGLWVLPDTGSMEPTTVGCDVHVYTPATDVDVGDVVVYDAHWRSGLVIHRVVAEREDGYVLQGDNNPAPDPEVVTDAQILSEVDFVVHTGSVLKEICTPVSSVAVSTYERSAERESGGLPGLIPFEVRERAAPARR